MKGKRLFSGQAAAAFYRQKKKLCFIYGPGYDIIQKTKE
jgi:hypothetical protein